MSRWIDADALPRHGQRGGLVHWKDIEDAPTIEPNLVLNPDEVKRGDVTMIGSEIVVMHYDDYMEMMLKSAAVDDESWERFVAEPCEDAISREWLLKFFEEDEGKDRHTPIDSLIALIKDAPSVTPSRPSGEWIPCSEMLPSKNGMKGFADGFLSCFKQFKDYIEKDPETAIEKMQNIVDFVDDFVWMTGLDADTGLCEEFIPKESE